MKLCLGTVQFGMDYGIRGQKRPHIKDVFDMLDYAVSNDVSTIDTANAYGIAEEVVGAWLRGKSRSGVFLVSKLKPNILPDNPGSLDISDIYAIIKENLTQSLQRLGTDFLDAYLLHSPGYVFDDNVLQAMASLKKEGYVGQVGVSVYEPAEAMHAISHPGMDMVQLPYSIFDQRMKYVFSKCEGTVLHGRSAFIQGLILMDESDVPEFLHKARPILRDIDAACRETGYSRIRLAIGYVKQQKALSHLVFGVDSLEQLKEDVALFNEDIPREVCAEISRRFKKLDADIVMPSLWKK